MRSAALCALVHVTVFQLVWFYDISLILVPSPKTDGSCSLPSLFSLHCLNRNCVSYIHRYLTWTIRFFFFKAMVAIFALKWHLSVLLLCLFQSARNALCVLHEVKQFFWYLTPQITDSPVLHYFWCCVTILLKKNSV